MEKVEKAFKTIDKCYDVHAITTRDGWSSAFPSAKESLEKAENSTASIANSKIFELDTDGYLKRVHTLISYSIALDNIITECIREGTYKTDLLHHKVEEGTGIIYDMRVKEVRVIEVYEDGDNSMPIFHRYVLQCKKCGKIKKKVI